MAKTVSVIGLVSPELYWIRLLVSLLRHPDPSVPELAHQALLYLTESCCRPDSLQRPAIGDPLDPRASRR